MDEGKTWYTVKGYGKEKSMGFQIRQKQCQIWAPQKVILNLVSLVSKYCILTYALKIGWKIDNTCQESRAVVGPRRCSLLVTEMIMMMAVLEWSKLIPEKP